MSQNPSLLGFERPYLREMVARRLRHLSLRALSHFDTSTRGARADAGRVGVCLIRMGRRRRPNPSVSTLFQISLFAARWTSLSKPRARALPW